MNVKTQSKNWLSVSLILIIWLNGLIPFVSSASFLSSINKNTNIDAVLICTTSGYKWVSKSAMYETSTLVFIDDITINDNSELPPIDHANCPIVVLADQSSSIDTTSALSFFPIENTSQSYTHYFRHDVSANAYLIASPRAPPITC